MKEFILTVLLGTAAFAGASEWKLAGSSEWNTAKEKNAVLHFTGSGGGSSEARRQVAPFEPGNWYVLDFELRTELKHREWPIGAPFVELPFRRDEFWDPSRDWRHMILRYQAPPNLPADADYIVCGQKDHTGDVEMRNFRLRRVEPQALLVNGDTPLRRHEAIYDGIFYANEERETLGRRTEFTEENPLILHYELPGRNFSQIRFVFNGSNTRIAVSPDGKSYTAVGEHENNATTHSLPDAKNGFFIRLTPRDNASPGSLVHTRLTARVDGNSPECGGQTFFWEKAPESALKLLPIGFDPQTMRYTFQLADAGREPVSLYDNGKLRVTAAPVDGVHTFQTTLPETGERTLVFATARQRQLARLDVNLPVIADLSHGRTLADTPQATVWSADSAYRVNRFRPAPETAGTALQFDLAGNEYQSGQLIVRGKQSAPLTLDAADLVAADGGRLPKEMFEIRLVEQLFLTNPTDSSAVAGYWPDPVSVLPENLATAAGENTALMVTLKSAKDTKPGIYEGVFTLKVGAETIPVRVQVRIRNFTLPDTLRAPAVSDLGTRYVEEAHRAKTIEEKRRVFNRYLELYAANHIAPYDPTPYDQPTVDWENNSVDFTRYEQELKRVLAEYHFNRFTVKLPLPPGVEHLKDAMTPEQEAQFAAVAQAFETFYEKNGLLDRAFVYVWDEPHVNVFADVDRCLERIRKHAPKLKLMLTPFWVQARWRPKLDIWAFLSHHYVDFAAEECRKNNEELWWYLCTNPRAPYATGFIDHGGAEMRTWLWQTFQYKMDGTLYWSAVYWCDPNTAGYPARNVYEQPMLFNETGNEFGNGDGLLVYPPRAAFAGGTEVVETAPASSLRLMAWRDGLEDFEYLTLLKQRNPKSPLLKVPSAISSNLYRYDRMPDSMNLHRAKIADELERLRPAAR